MCVISEVRHVYLYREVAMVWLCLSSEPREPFLWSHACILQVPEGGRGLR